MQNFKTRLRQERKRLGLKGGELADIGGVSAVSQSSYENGKQVPGATYLAAIAAVGVDVMYLLTGERSGDFPLTEEDRTLLFLYHKATPALRQAALAALVGGMGAVHVGRDNNGEITINGARR